MILKIESEQINFIQPDKRILMPLLHWHQCAKIFIQTFFKTRVRLCTSCPTPFQWMGGLVLFLDPPHLTFQLTGFDSIPRDSHHLSMDSGSSCHGVMAKVLNGSLEESEFKLQPRTIIFTFNLILSGKVWTPFSPPSYGLNLPFLKDDFGFK